VSTDPHYLGSTLANTLWDTLHEQYHIVCVCVWAHACVGGLVLARVSHMHKACEH
jgi:hypothetical protein